MRRDTGVGRPPAVVQATSTVCRRHNPVNRPPAGLGGSLVTTGICQQKTEESGGQRIDEGSAWEGNRRSRQGRLGAVIRTAAAATGDTINCASRQVPHVEGRLHRPPLPLRKILPGVAGDHVKGKENPLCRPHKAERPVGLQAVVPQRA
jgi:hypothetical protein